MSKDFEPTDFRQSLVHLDLFKATAVEGSDGDWTFQGVASDESADVEGDELLKNIMDLSYAQTRGYVNWNHSQEPSDQLGFLTKCHIIAGEQVLSDLSKSMGQTLSPTASVYVEGQLYKNVSKAKDVYDVLRSAPAFSPGMGISLEGGLARNTATGKLVKAVVRGIAITPKPAHPLTMMKLRKSLEQVTGELAKTEPGPQAYSFDEAVLWVLRQRPNWNYGLATKFVTYTQQKTQGV